MSQIGKRLYARGLLAAFIVLAGCAPVPAVAQAGAREIDPRLERVVADYVGLYRRETLDKWEQLFLPSFTVASTRPDGSTGLRTRDEFFQAQRAYHARVDNLKEELENVRIEQRGRLASVWADFVVTESGQKNRGRLVLLVIQDRGEYRIHSLMFSYDR
jgi:hypothetical protein